MSNSYFQFKQMRIEQDLCAMKVSTDACIQGAWTPIDNSVQRVLDIGTGTGLLSLMFAQRSASLEIDALEIDTLAAQQAAKNVSDSVFAAQIKVHQTDANNWSASDKYDLIICNPPFFSNSLQGKDKRRNLARHNDHLTQEALLSAILKNLSTEGISSILLPITEQKNWETLAKTKGLYISKRLLIKPYEHSEANRVVLLCSREERSAIENTPLIIYTEAGKYSTEFSELLRPFYLHL